MTALFATGATVRTAWLTWRGFRKKLHWYHWLWFFLTIASEAALVTLMWPIGLGNFGDFSMVSVFFAVGWTGLVSGLVVGLEPLPKLLKFFKQKLTSSGRASELERRQNRKMRKNEAKTVELQQAEAVFLRAAAELYEARGINALAATVEASMLLDLSETKRRRH